MKLHFESSLPTLFNNHWKGVSLPPLGIYFRDERGEVHTDLLKHEFTHWAQYKRMGAVKYYLTILAQYILDGYQGSALEIEARAAEEEPLTDEEFAWWEASIEGAEER